MLTRKIKLDSKKHLNILMSFIYISTKLTRKKKGKENQELILKKPIHTKIETYFKIFVYED